MTLNPWPFFLHFLSTGITDMCHWAWFIWWWGSSQGLHECWGSTPWLNYTTSSLVLCLFWGRTSLACPWCILSSERLGAWNPSANLPWLDCSLEWLRLWLSPVLRFGLGLASSCQFSCFQAVGLSSSRSPVSLHEGHWFKQFEWLCLGLKVLLSPTCCERGKPGLV